MIRTIFRNTFLVGLSVLFLCAVLFFGMQYTERTEETCQALQQEALYAEKGLLLGGEAYLRSLDAPNRITWIGADGEVLYDSEMTLPLQNQKDYAEVRSALDSGEGHGIRSSESNGESTMFYAKKCQDGTVLRLSTPLSAIRYALVAVSPVLWVLVLVLLISGVLAFRVAKQIVSPINEMDVDNPSASLYPELAPLIQKLQEQKLTIQEQIEEREQLRREFSANVSHELKTPLTSISGFAELLSQGVVTGDKVQEFSKDIYKESQRMIALIDDIIRLSRLDENSIEPATEPVDLYALSADILESMRPVAEKQSIVLRQTGTSESVVGVRQLLSEMVYNLCDNAIKYNRPGGSVTVDVHDAPEGVVLSVSDTGIGIPENHQKRVFERFYRVDKSHSKAIGGTGLGLSIVKHGAIYHGASVNLESSIGVGTTVTLTFPHPGQKPGGTESPAGSQAS